MPSLRKNKKSGINLQSKHYRYHRESGRKEFLKMADFKVINSQEELDRIIQERLNRQKESIEAKFADYDQLKTEKEKLASEVVGLKSAVEDYDTKSKTYEETLADLNSKVSNYETENLRTKIAIKNGLPLDLVNRLMGEDEATIDADAQKLAAYIKTGEQIAPLKNTEPNLGDGKDGAYKNLLNNLNLEGE